MAQYDSKTKEGKCIFCEIAKGKIKTSGVFWENEKYLAFLTPFPNTEGFSIVLPKKHFGSDVLEMSNEELKEFILVSKEISRLLKRHFKDVGRVGLMIEGTGIDHAHIKLFPMHGTEHLKKGRWKQYLDEGGKFFDNYEGYITSIEGPRWDDNKIKELAEEIKLTIKKNK